MMTRNRGLKSLAWLALCAGAIGFLSGCHSGVSAATTSLQYAYIGPATAMLREDLAARSSQVTSAKHGERVEIVDARRRLVRVKTEAGVEGWIDANLLLTAQQMRELNRVTELASKLPVEGKATVGDPLNVHTGANRQSPTLFQIPENGSLEVLAHRSVPRTAQASDVAAALQNHPFRAKKPKAKALPETEAPAIPKNPAKSAALPPLPMPPPPAPPAHWERLSVPRLGDLNKTEKSAAESAPLPPDDWTLIRAADHETGWVLSRMLSMSIPDDVIRYTEGRRVTAYLDLGEVPDEGRGKHNWVWTTTAARGAPYDFDSFRVLIWNPVKHRYETAHSERGLAGYYPLQRMTTEEGQAELAKAETARAAEVLSETKTAPEGKGKPRRHKGPSHDERNARADRGARKDEKFFSLTASDADGSHMYRRVYGLAERRVRLISTAVVPPSAQLTVEAGPNDDPLAAQHVQKNWLRSALDWFRKKA